MTFKILALKKIKCFLKSDTIIIQKYIDWTCASRYQKYQLGQEAIYFLEINSKNKLETMGAANEGELVVKSDTAYVYSHDSRTFESNIYPFISDFQKYIKASLKTTISGIKLYLDNLDGINREIYRKGPGQVAYQYSSIDRLPYNFFLNIVIDQKRRGFA